MPDKTDEENEARPWRRPQSAGAADLEKSHGEVLATGRMGNYASGSVIVVDETGKEVARLPWHRTRRGRALLPERLVAAAVGMPAGRTTRRASGTGRRSVFAWHASALCHKPLYFEEVQLERYGHTDRPVHAAVHQRCSLLPEHRHAALSHGHQPAARVPVRPRLLPPRQLCSWMIQPVPLSLRGGLAQAGVVVGGVFLIP